VPSVVQLKLVESIMSDLSPAQRTATTAKIILGTGIVAWPPAFMHGSVTASLLAALLMAFGGGLLVAARRAD
jgi:hypothetical protein